MIHGHKPNGHYSTTDGAGHRMEGETRQCIHCQYTWEYGDPHLPGQQGIGESQTRRGYCIQCGGFLCGRLVCQTEQKRLVELMRVRHNQTRSCVPWEEWNNRLRDQFGHKKLEPDLTITDSGLIVPRVDFRTGGQ